MKTHHDNPFYDFVFASIGDSVPSTRAGYKNVVGTGEVIPNPESPSVHKFRTELRECLRDYPGLKVPFSGRILIALSVGLKPDKYATRDIDNMTKSLLDALKTVAYDDDRQIDVLHVVKFKSEYDRWYVGIKALADTEPLWKFPPLYLESPMGL